jgi:CTP synthase (UTP-ammonia lyase)
MTQARIAVVGDFDSEKLAHRAIDACFTLAQAEESLPVERAWIPTQSIISGDESALRNFHGLWSAPGSPYRNTEGALWAITFARAKKVPFLGTCGGVQHALLEYARNVLGLKDADHAETNPGTAFPLLYQMQCSLVEKAQKVIMAKGTPFAKLYGADSGLEEFHCRYGLNPRFEHLFRNGPIEVVARSEEGEARAIALREHPFFIGTLFQPERRALKGALHPLVRAFFAASVRPAV